jgi:hypothetical protein
MKVTGKKYGFNIIAAEEMRTVVGLWDATKRFVEEMQLRDTPMLSLFGDKSYNGIHYWCVFSI